MNPKRFHLLETKTQHQTEEVFLRLSCSSETTVPQRDTAEKWRDEWEPCCLSVSHLPGCTSDPQTASHSMDRPVTTPQDTNNKTYRWNLHFWSWMCDRDEPENIEQDNRELKNWKCIRLRISVTPPPKPSPLKGAAKVLTGRGKWSS